jgi:hypothetical protein
MTEPSPLFRRQLLRSLDRRTFLRSTLAITVGGAAFYTIGCSSSGSDAKTPATTQAAGSATAAKGATPSTTANPSGIRPSLLTQEFVANRDNRFAVGLVGPGNQLVTGAEVHLKFFTIGADGVTGTFRGEGDAKYVELNVPGAHAHDSSGSAAASDDTVSFYVANTPFDQVGKWAVEIDATLAGGAGQATVQAPFAVLDQPLTPGIGTTPPASRNDTFATNSNLESLCSRTPACPLHDKVIGDVLGQGRPLVVMFSTPAFCTSRFCGPVLEVLLAQVPTYQDRIDFVHIEVWQDFQLQKHRPAADEWNLPTEPYTFFMGKGGKVAGKLEGVFGQDELTSALDQLAKL